MGYAEKLAGAKTEGAKSLLKKVAPYAVGAAGAGAAIAGGKAIHESGKKKGYKEGFGRGVRMQRLSTQLRRGARAEMVLRQAAARRMAQRRAGEKTAAPTVAQEADILAQHRASKKAKVPVAPSTSAAQAAAKPRLSAGAAKGLRLGRAAGAAASGLALGTAGYMVGKKLFGGNKG
jgi:hypothetical protein